jgi:hypothetical protein
MSEQRVTDLQNLGERPADNDVVHIVDVSDTSQNPAGSSKKVTAGEIREGLATDDDISNFETTTQLNARDTANRDRDNHTGTQTASTISDFNTAVSANSDVTANTAARHDAVTLAGTPNYLTIAGQVITRNLINLADHVTGRLGFDNLPQGTARSVVGRAGSGNGDVANISAGNDTILSRSGSGNVAFNTPTTVRTILNVADGATANTGIVESVVAGTNVTVDATDPANPIVSATGELSGSGITVSDTAPEDPEEGDFWLDTSEELELWRGSEFMAGEGLTAEDGKLNVTAELEELAAPIGYSYTVFKDGDDIVAVDALAVEQFREPEDPSGLRLVVNACVNALTDGGTILLKAGTYTLDLEIIDASSTDISAKGISLNSNQQFIGEGRGATIIQMSPVNYETVGVYWGMVEVQGASSARKKNCTIADMTLNFRRDVHSGSMSSANNVEIIELEYADDCIVERVEMLNGRADGYDSDKTTGCVIKDCFIDNCGGYGIHISKESAEHIVHGNRVTNCGSANTRGGIDALGGTSNCIYTGNFAKDNYRNYNISGTGHVFIGNQSIDGANADVKTGVAGDGS